MQKNTRKYYIPERFLRQLWKHQYFATTELRTTEGKPIKIISPGTLNRDEGPDFINASVRINEILYRGEIELHQYTEDWFGHHHQQDPRYNGVILHVVLHHTSGTKPTSTHSKRVIPVLSLEHFLTSPFNSMWHSMILDERAERLGRIKCYPLNDRLEVTTIRRWLEKLGIERIELKVRRCDERLKELVKEQRFSVSEPLPGYQEFPFGLNPDELPIPETRYSTADFRILQLWNQSLYEGVMEALGYSKNQKPFLKLAQRLPLQFFDEVIIPQLKNQVRHIEGVLFGVAGLLPSPRASYDTDSNRYLRDLRSDWNRYRRHYKKELMNESDWQFFRLRPENFPTIRLAGAARLIPKIVQKDFFKNIIQLIKNRDLKIGEKVKTLEQMFIVPADGFWSTHFRFGKPAKTILKTLIGKNRTDDIILNRILPLCLLYARIFKDKEVRQGALKLYELWLPLTENTVTRIMITQLIRDKMLIKSAMLQQGVLQLYKFYCIEEQCSECAIGKKIFQEN